MQTMRCVGVSGVAEYCGVSTTTVHQWINRHGPDTGSSNPMPIPAVAVMQGKRSQSQGEYVTYGWKPHQLADLRVWYSSIKGWDDRQAAHHWVEVDATLKAKDDATRNG